MREAKILQTKTPNEKRKTSQVFTKFNKRTECIINKCKCYLVCQIKYQNLQKTEQIKNASNNKN